MIKDNKLRYNMESFTKAMMDDIEEYEIKGYTGWDNENWLLDLKKLGVIEHLETGNYVAAANYAMFLWYQSRNGT